ncbi:hypothetical protein IV203_038667 [Nitzschia inconspicua]|uniref:Uncharacterized protein n=1 Tax=Nitzschia inconspicua TaxID=303405 RepID=A0A9K3LPA5_9STRA|nr:hypothetical protein IV203_038667 [Nitzschia inconspicua]
MVTPTRLTRSSVMLLSLLCVTVTTAAVTIVEGAKFNPMETLFQPRQQRPSLSLMDKQQQQQQQQKAAAEEEEFATRSKQFIPPLQDAMAPTPEEREAERMARRERNRERRAKINEAMKKVQPTSGGVERISKEEFETMQRQHPEFRKLWGSGSTSHMIEYADPGDDYDMWQQAYRMLGGFIDCDHQKSQGSGDHNNNNNNNNNEGGQNSGACSRWMMWASYVDPNYQGYGRDEYFGDEPVGVLDCHKPDTDWVLLGVYRQEFYQFIEQISKHLWAIDEYEYVVALAGLAYMTDDDCFYVGTSNSGTSIYAGVAPQPYGGFQMALYTDGYCLTPDNSLGKTFDDFGLQNEINLGSKDQTEDDTYNWAYDWWFDTQEYTLTQLNEVYDQYKFCTSCIDYPTYQDGYVIGDTGMDDDDLINQCWKFYSHDSFPCEADCIALGHSQGTILSVSVGNKMFGQPLQEFYNDVQISSSKGGFTKESKFTRLLANAFVTFSFIVFVATFLAFAVARRSRYRESRGSKSRRLLDDDDDRKSVRRKSKSRSRKDEDGDGVFRSDRSRKSRSKSAKRRSSSGKSTRNDNDEDYEPPRRSRSRKRSSSRLESEDF